MIIIKAIDNNYYGIIRIILNISDFEEYIKIKNEENKNIILSNNSL